MRTTVAKQRYSAGDELCEVHGFWLGRKHIEILSRGFNNFLIKFLQGNLTFNLGEEKFSVKLLKRVTTKKTRKLGHE